MENKNHYQGLFIKAKAPDMRFALQEAYKAGVREGEARVQKAPPETIEVANPKITVDKPPSPKSQTRKQPAARQPKVVI